MEPPQTTPEVERLELRTQATTRISPGLPSR